MDKYDTDYKDYYVTDGPYEYTRLGKQYSETIYKKVGNLEIAKDPRIIEQVHRDADLSEEICMRVLKKLISSDVTVTQMTEWKRQMDGGLMWKHSLKQIISVAKRIADKQEGGE